MSRRIAGYAPKTPPELLTRLIVVVPKEEAAQVDDWGIAAGMPSRSAAIRFLVKKGLEAAGTTATGQVSQA